MAEKRERRFALFFKKHPFFSAQMLLTLLFALLYFLQRKSEAFSEWFATHPARLCRTVLAKMTGWIPFSVFEIFLFCAALFLLFLLGLLIAAIVKKLRAKKVSPWAIKAFLALPVLLSIIFNLFCLTLSPGYYRVSTAKNLSLQTEITEEEAFRALEILIAELNTASEKLSHNENGETVCPYSFDELSRMTFSLADSFAEKHPFYQKGGAEAKVFLSSPLLTYTHISGVYGFFTGEANINTNFPHPLYSFTLLHEYSHARGIAPENECNFLAFAIGLESEDAYIRYCSVLNVFDSLASACRRADRARYDEVISSLHPAVFADFRYHNTFLDRFEAPKVVEAADAVNSAYLQSQGQKEGTLTYTQTTELVVAYTLQYHSA